MDHCGADPGTGGGDSGCSFMTSVDIGLGPGTGQAQHMGAQPVNPVGQPAQPRNRAGVPGQCWNVEQD